MIWENFYGNSDILLAMFKTDMKFQIYVQISKKTGHAWCTLTVMVRFQERDEFLPIDFC